MQRGQSQMNSLGDSSVGWALLPVCFSTYAQNGQECPSYKSSSRTYVLLLIAGLLFSLPQLQSKAEETALSSYYGFKPLETFKLSQRSSSLVSGDLNHDGRTDLLLIDNGANRIDLLIQRTSAPTEPEKKLGKTDVNAVTDHWRFEHRKLPVDQEVAAVTLGDFNGDGWSDIAYFGLPDQLVIRYQKESGDWTSKKQIRVPDTTPAPWFLAAGDLDGNGFDDLVVLGKNETIVFHQTKKGLSEPKKLMNTSDKLALAQIADLDGDGRHDLCYLAGEGLARSLGTRLQLPDGQLGPEYIFDLERPRAVSLRDIDGKPGQEILAIDSRTGRLKILNVERKQPSENELPERLIQFGFGKQGSGRERDLAIGDLDGDGLADVVVSDPDASRILVFRQQSSGSAGMGGGGGLDLGVPYSGLSGADQIRMADLNGDGTVEVVVHSGPEKTLGLSRFEEGRLTFPESLPIESETNGFELVDLDGDKIPEVVFVAKAKKERSSEYSIQALKRTTDGDWTPHKFGDKSSIGLKGDVTGDNRPELLLFQGASKPTQVFGLDETGLLKEIVISGNLGLGSVSPGAISIATLGDRKGVLIAQENFARFMVLGDNRRWQVAEQFNAGESNSKIVGAVIAELDGKGEPEIVLVDSGVKKIRILRHTEGTYSQWKEIEIGEFPYKSIRVADLNGDRRDDLLLFGTDKYAVLYPGAPTPALKEVASFESQLEKIYPTDVVAGDLNGDGKIDLAITDTRSHFIEVLQYRSESGLKHAMYFRIFEQKSFRNEDESGDAEPREALVTDVTGDGLVDLLLLTHDRLLLYPQDDGRQKSSP
ncbi:MAG: VCBS repeat-containing protein [Planctomycetes bacterium]|nr:VCBS repeat-containing protein [Planctomycetota bacterium]